MFKIIMRMAVLSSLLVLSWSCEVTTSSYSSRDSSSLLISFGKNLVSESSDASVSVLRKLSMSGETIDEAGFTYTTHYTKTLTLDVVWVAENCWEVTGTGETTNFNLQVLRESSDRLDDEYRWTVISLSLDYDESNGYTAVMTTNGDIVYEWYVSDTSSSKSWDLLQNGTYYVQTYISNDRADSCLLTYSRGSCTAVTYTISFGSGTPD